MTKRHLLWIFLGLFISAVSCYASISRTLIDFSKYDQLIQQEYSEYTDSIVSNIDGEPKLFIGYKDYLLDNWKVELNSSGSQMQNKMQSYCKSVQSQRFGTTLGVRVHFQNWNNNCYALVKPPFDIKIYDTNGNYVNAGNGVMPNVSEIKTVSLWAYGNNFNMNIAVRFIDRDQNIQEYFMGPLYYDGWRRLVYENPNYTENIQAKVLHREPLYPYDVPYLALDSFVIYKPSDTLGGDFVTYLASVSMDYSPYMIDNMSNDIQDEQVWGIITARLQHRADIENSRLAEDLYLYQQEAQREQVTNDIKTTNK